jgi:hypothetical protein
MIYLAIPYIHKNPDVMDLRAAVSDIIAADLMTKGTNVFAPISSWHHIAKKYDLPRDWTYWYEYDKYMLSVCNMLLVVILDGWIKSTGVKEEIILAKKFNIPADYIDPAPYVERIKKEGIFSSKIIDVYGKTNDFTLVDYTEDEVRRHLKEA